MERYMFWSKIDKKYILRDDMFIWGSVLPGQYNGKKKSDVSIWNEYRRYKIEPMKACMIQTAFKRAISNPEYRMCRNRLMKEFLSLTA